MSYNDVMDMQC